MRKKAFYNVKIEKWKVKVVLALQWLASPFDIFHIATVITITVTIILWVIFRWDVGVALVELCELLGSLPRQGSLIFQGFFMIMFHPYSWKYLFPILLRLQLLRLLSRACSDPEVRGESLLHEAPMVKIPLVQVFTFLTLDWIKSPPRCLLLRGNKNIQHLLNCFSLF